jgi:hypothetical protein
MFLVLLPPFGVFLSNGKAHFGSVASRQGLFGRKNPMVRSIDRILRHFGFWVYQIIKCLQAQSGLFTCCVATSRPSLQDRDDACFSMRHAVNRAGPAACCGADGTPLAIGLLA